MSMIATSTSGLKAKLGQFMKAVRDGKEVVITDRDRPIARLVPYRRAARAREALVTTPKDPAAPTLGKLKIRAISYQGRDSTALLREDRERR
jgi:prevent-host-death family protein